MTFGQNAACIYGFWPKNLRVYVIFGQKFVYVRDFWPKTRVYREDSGKNHAKGQTNKGECQWMKIL